MTTEPKNFKLECEFTDIIKLYRSYMPFVEHGAVFIPTEDESIQLGDLVSATIKLPEDENPVHFTGKVIWVTPKKLLSEEAKMGIGVQIEGDSAADIQSQIEDLIKDYLNSDQPTDTM